MQTRNANICVAVTNYDFSGNASELYKSLSQEFNTILIDASSPHPPEEPHISIPNDYYPGLWNAAVRHAIDNQFEWLFFIASDVRVENIKQLCNNIREAVSYDEIGIYTPSLASNSRCAFPSIFTKATAFIRESGHHEGFAFLARTQILSAVYPVDLDRKFGWGVDVECSFEAYRQQKLVVVDDRTTIFHPKRKAEHEISEDLAREEMNKAVNAEIRDWAAAKQKLISNKIFPLNKTSSLDLGCGPNPKNAFGASVVHGIDFREDPSKNIRAADLNIEPIPHDDSTFDYVTANDFIEHVSRLLYVPHRRFPFVELMNEIYRVLKPGGVFLSITPAYPDSKAFQDPTHVNIITEETFKSYFCEKQYWARMYGFTGRFRLLSQKWDDGKLVTFMRALK